MNALHYDDFYDDEDDLGQCEYCDESFDRQPAEQYFMPPQGGQAGQAPAPMSAPPSFSPPFPAWQQGSGGIRMCLYRNTFIWLRNGNSFWFFPTFISRNMIIGFRWRGIGWVYNV